MRRLEGCGMGFGKLAATEKPIRRNGQPYPYVDWKFLSTNPAAAKQGKRTEAG